MNGRSHGLTNASGSRPIPTSTSINVLPKPAVALPLGQPGKCPASAGPEPIGHTDGLGSVSCMTLRIRHDLDAAVVWKKSGEFRERRF
jgi:hypothetical protein